MCYVVGENNALAKLRKHIMAPYAVGDTWNMYQLLLLKWNIYTTQWRSAIQKKTQQKKILQLTNIFKTNGVCENSIIISAPPGHGKHIVTYTCMQYSIKHNKKTLPVFNTMATECLNMHNFQINARMFVSLITKPTEWMCAATIDPVQQPLT